MTTFGKTYIVGDDTESPFGETTIIEEEPTLNKEEPTLTSELKHGVKQLATGFSETFGSSPMAVDELGWGANLIPNFAWQLGGLGGMAAGYGENKLLKYAASGIENAERNFDTTPERTMSDVANRVGGSMLMPAMSSVKAVTLPQKIAKGASYVLAPGVQSKSGLGLAAELAVPTIVGDQLIETISPETYDSGIYNQEEPSPFGATTIIEAPDAEEIADSVEEKSWFDLDVMVGAGIATLLTGTGSQMIRSAVRAKTARRLVYDASEIMGRDESLIKKANRASRKAATSDTSGSYLKDTKGRAMNVTPDPDGYFGKATLWDAQGRDAGALWRKLLKDVKKSGKITPEKYEKMLDVLITQLEAPAQAVRLKDWVKSGQLIGTKKFTYSAVQLEETAARLLKKSPKTWQKLNESLILGTRLDDIERGTYKTWGGYTAEDIKWIIKQNDLDPIVKKLRQQHLKFYRDILDDTYYNHNNGLTNADNYKKWSKGSKHYVPLKAEGTGAYDADMFSHRNPDLTKGLQPGQIAPPTDMVGEYAIRMGKFSMDNNARRTLIDLIMEADDVVTHGGRPLFEYADIGKGRFKLGDNTIKIIRNGHEEFIQVNDPYLKLLLQESPDWASKHYGGLMRSVVAATNLFKTFTVGKGNPAFVTTSAGYDMLGTLIQAPKGQNIGVISKHLNKYLGTTDAFRHDFTAIANPFTGAMQAVWSDVMFAGARSMQATIDAGQTTQLRKFLGQNYEPFMNRMKQAYLKSGKRLYEKQGSGTTLLWGDAQSTHPDIMRELAPAMNDVTPGQPIKLSKEVFADIKSNIDPNSSSIFRQLSALLDAGHSGNRLGAFSKNLDRSWTWEPMVWIDRSGRSHTFKNLKIPSSTVGATDDAMQHSGRLFRETGGDLGKKSGIPGTKAGVAMRGVGDAIPFTNPAIQASTRLAKALKEDFVGTASAISALTLTGAAYIFTGIKGNEAAWEQYKEWGASNRGRRIPFYNAEGELIFAFDIAHEYRPAWSGIIESLMQVDGAIDKENSVPLRSAFERAYQDIIPFGGGVPALNVLSTITSGEPLDYHLQSGLNYAFGLEGGRNAFRSGTNPNANRNRAIDGVTQDELYKRASGVLNEIIPIHKDAIIHGALALLNGFDDQKSISDISKQLALNMTPTLTQRGKATSLLFPDEQRVAERKNRSFPWVTDVYNTRNKAKNWIRMYDKHLAHPETRRKNVQFPTELMSTLPARFRDPIKVDAISKAMKLMVRDLQSPAFGKLESALGDISYHRDADFLNTNVYSIPTAQRNRGNQYNAQQLKVLNEAAKIIDMYEQDLKGVLNDPSFSFSELGLSPEVGELVNTTGDSNVFLPQ